VLMHSTNYSHLRAFLEELSKLWAGWPKELRVKFREAEDGSQVATIEDLRRWLQAKGVSLIAQPQTAGRDRKFFHDRRVVLAECTSARCKEALVLLTGGVDRYMNQRVEYSIVVQNELGKGPG
jgi:hypothetical protein